jgi:hypothetical protein
MDKNINGKQNKKYFSEYYFKNKERIQKRSKIKYQLDRNSPEKLLQIRKRCTEATKRWRGRHPETVKNSAKLQRRSRKIRAMRMIGEVKCCRCGCDEIDFLEVNHKNGGGCKEWRENKGRITDRILMGKRNTDGLEILCRVCNALDFLERKNKEASEKYKIYWE